MKHDVLDLPAHVVRYAEFFNTMTAATVPDLRTLVTPDVHFRDPFNDVRGAAVMERIMTHMFDTCDEVQFGVVDTVAAGDMAFLTWRFRFRPRRLRGAAWQVDGVTELRFDEAGLVTAHLDYWDSGSQFFARLPVLGWFVRKVGARLQVV